MMAMSHSLRARLLWFLLAAISVAAVTQAAIAYRTAREDGVFGDADAYAALGCAALEPGRGQ